MCQVRGDVPGQGHGSRHPSLPLSSLVLGCSCASCRRVDRRLGCSSAPASRFTRSLAASSFLAFFFLAPLPLPPSSSARRLGIPSARSRSRLRWMLKCRDPITQAAMELRLNRRLGGSGRPMPKPYWRIVLLPFTPSHRPGGWPHSHRRPRQLQLCQVLPITCRVVLRRLRLQGAL